MGEKNNFKTLRGSEKRKGTKGEGREKGAVRVCLRKYRLNRMYWEKTVV